MWNTLLLCLLLSGQVTGNCLFGDEPGCYFPCRCSNASECSEGICPGGCQLETTDFQTPWRGPGCQIGNVAFNKDATQNGGSRAADRAVDGKQEGDGYRYCAEPNAGAGNLAEWTVDLGDIHKIYNVTIYNRNSEVLRYRMEYFDIHTSNNTVDTLLCHRHTTPPIQAGIGTTFTCNQPQVGRFVHISRTGGKESNLLSLCEMIVIGHKYIDCAQITCQEGVCNDVTGCPGCLGSYRPNCTIECLDGLHGINCAEKCGNCSGNEICNKDTGKCSGGCQLWWADDTCKTQIDPPRLHNETDTLEGAAVSNSSVVLQWVQMYSVPASLAEYYQYTVMYRDNTGLFRNEQTDYVVYTNVSHNASLHLAEVTITRLQHNARYDVIVVPQRGMNGIYESANGTVYKSIVQKTSCIKPEMSNFNFSVRGDGTNNMPVMVVTYEDIRLLDSGCDNVVSAAVQYTSVNDTMNVTSEALDTSQNSYTVQLDSTGQYIVWIVVVNNEELSSISSQQSVDVEEIPLPGPATNITKIVVPIVVVLVLVVVAVLLVLFFLKRKKRTKEDSTEYNSNNLVPVIGSETGKAEGFENILNIGDENSEASTQKRSSAIRPVIKPKPSLNHDEYTDPEEQNIYMNNSEIPVEQFEDYVIGRKRNMDDFKAEYENLPQEDFGRCQVGQTELNKKQNRFKNIFPYDDTRVVLKTGNENETSYINANYISGYDSPKKYIATQGPLHNTVTHFWAMVWQENVNRIVMVANLKENMKQRCHPYWSVDTGSSLEFGPFTVTTEASETCADYVTSILTLQCGPDQKTVRHFHFTTWVDKDKPLFGASSLLAFYRIVHSFDYISKGPLVVHCSAGVGRTGTFIVLDSLMKKIQAEGTVDVKASVQKARVERMTMVQTKAQYFFIHDVLVEYIKCGDTSIPCANFQNIYKKLTQHKSGTDFIKKQFLILCELQKSRNTGSQCGLLEKHLHKNRNKTVIPDDSVRPYLPGTEDNSYINAVFVDSFKAHDHYVVTQMPLPHTVGDFWRLVHTQETTTIIMLNQIPQDDQSSLPYWPTDVTAADYDGVEVKLLKTQYVSKSLIVRDFVISVIRRGQRSEDQTIKHFQLLTWPSDKIYPSSPGDLIDLVDHVSLWYRKQTHSKVIGNTVLHCIDGVAHSGMYCALTYLLDRMKLEQDVDPFLAARSVSRNRPEFFQTMDQYQFLYTMAAEYFARNNEYENFQ